MKNAAMKPQPAMGIGNRIGRLVALSVFSAIIIVATALAYIQVNRDIETRRSNLENTGFVMASGVADALVAKNRNAALATFRRTTAPRSRHTIQSS